MTIFCSGLNMLKLCMNVVIGPTRVSIIFFEKKTPPCSTSNMCFLLLVTEVCRWYVQKYLIFHMLSSQYAYSIHTYVQNVWPERTRNVASSNRPFMTIPNDPMLPTISSDPIVEVLSPTWPMGSTQHKLLRVCYFMVNIGFICM